MGTSTVGEVAVVAVVDNFLLGLWAQAFAALLVLISLTESCRGTGNLWLWGEQVRWYPYSEMHLESKGIYHLNSNSNSKDETSLDTVRCTWNQKGYGWNRKRYGGSLGRSLRSDDMVNMVHVVLDHGRCEEGVK